MEAFSARVPALASTCVPLTNDCHPDGGCGAGYVSVYTLATGTPYTDQTLDECTISKGRQNEPAVAVNPRNTRVLVGSSNDYCGVYNRGTLAGAIGPIWLGYYRSLDGGLNWISSLVLSCGDSIPPIKVVIRSTPHPTIPRCVIPLSREPQELTGRLSPVPILTERLESPAPETGSCARRLHDRCSQMIHAQVAQRGRPGDRLEKPDRPPGEVEDLRVFTRRPRQQVLDGVSGGQ